MTDRNRITARPPATGDDTWAHERAGPRRRRRAGLGALPLIGLALVSAATVDRARAEEVTVAFVGDQGTREAARDVISLIANAEVDLLVSGGDLGYSLGPGAWIANMDEILGEDFPVLAAVGNHEGGQWPVYRRWLEERVAALDELRCEGDIGVKAHCTFRGISIVQTAPGVHEVPGVLPHDGYDEYLAAELADSPNAWRICSWHKLMGAMQVGGKTNATGWGVYEACREGGGIAATAHEHSYSRTHLMSDFENRTVVHRRDHLEIGPGRTFAFVSGLGGQGIRAQKRGGDWWASVYSATQGATHGALFCTFAERTAECRFEDVAGGVPDRFTLETSNGAEPVPDAALSDVTASDGTVPDVVVPDELPSEEAETGSEPAPGPSSPDPTEERTAPSIEAPEPNGQPASAEPSVDEAEGTGEAAPASMANDEPVGADQRADADAPTAPEPPPAPDDAGASDGDGTDEVAPPSPVAGLFATPLPPSAPAPMDVDVEVTTVPVPDIRDAGPSEADPVAVPVAVASATPAVPASGAAVSTGGGGTAVGLLPFLLGAWCRRGPFRRRPAVRTVPPAGA